MLHEKNDRNVLDDVYPSMLPGPNPEEPQFKSFGSNVPKTDVKTLACIVVAAVIMISVFRALLGLP